MKTQEIDKSEAQKLRHQAEEQLLKRKLTNSFDKVDNLKLIHELQVHQIELEMQNEELVKSHALAEAAMEKYTDLYDFAPSGYLTLSVDGDITDLNFAAATMLNKDRSHLKNTRFALSVSHESLEVFNAFFEECFRSKIKQSCELVLKSNPEKPTYVHIDGHVSQIVDSFHITMFDISTQKAMEIELKKALDHYEGLNRYFMDREMRMIDLKKEINELLIKSGCEKEYLI